MKPILWVMAQQKLRWVGLTAVMHPVGDRTEDRYWKAGLLYVNSEEPALFVEKRFGIGYTLNFGRPASWIMLAALLLLPVGIALVVKWGSK